MTDSTDGWELLAQWPGGTVAALTTIHAARAPGLALAATAAGLHTSVDGGQSWRWVALGPDPVPEALAVSHGFERDRTVLLGTGSGLYRSTDGGERWRPALTGSRVQCIAATTDFLDSGVVLVGTERDGVLRSEDGGLDWAGASAGLLDLNVTALAISPGFARNRSALAGTATGLYRSRNGGRAWRLVELGPETPAVQALAISPAFKDDRLVLAGTESDGLFRSDDGGQTWEPVSSFPGPCVTGLAFGRPRGSGPIAAAGTPAGVAISPDGGVTWTLEAPELGPILSVAFAADGSLEQGREAILAGTVADGVVRRALDGGGWLPANAGLAGRATVGLAVSGADEPGASASPTVAVASLDAGVLVSPDGGGSWTSGQAGLSNLAASSVALVGQPAETTSLLATFADSLYRSSDGGATWQYVELPVGADGSPASTSVVATAVGSSGVVVAAGGSALALSLDGGETWQAVPLPAPHARIVGATTSPEVARDRTLYAVVRATRIAPDGTLEAAGLELWRTDDLGQRWARWLQSPAASVMTVVVPRPGDLDAALLVGHAGRVARPLRSAQETRRGERRPLWQEAQIGSLSASITALALSPHARREGIVLAAADDRVYLSRDGGATFGAWDHRLTVPLVTALAVLPAGEGHLDAYALGLGGTLWRRRL